MTSPAASWPSWLAVALALLEPACLNLDSGAATGPPGPAFCLAGSFPDAGGGAPPSSATLTLVVGSENGAGTRVGATWHEGDHVPLVAGGQGGVMIRPALDITAPAPLAEDGAHAACIGVRMLAGSPADAPAVVTGAMAPRIAGTPATYHVAPLFGLLSFGRNVDGATIGVAFDVLASERTGHAEVTVVPDSKLAP